MRDGWRVGHLSEFADLNPAEPPLPPEAAFVPMDAVEPGARWVRYTEERGSRGGCRFRAGDTLFARITPCLENGKVAQVQEAIERGGGSTEFIVLRARVDLLPDFLYLWASASETRDLAAGLMVGTSGRRRVSAQDLGALTIVVPPRAEQRRIVDLVVSAYDGVSKADGVADAARRAFSALAADLWRYEGRVELQSLGTVVTGQTPSTKQRHLWEPRSVPFLAPGDLDGRLVLEGAARGVSDEGARSIRVLAAPAVVQVCIGATIGKVAMTAVPMATNQQINALVGLDDTHAVLIAAALSAPPGQTLVQSAAGHTTMPILKKSSWASLQVPAVPDHEASGLAEMFLALDGLREAAAAQRRNVERLRSALLNRLLSGEDAIPDSYDRILEGV